jgi:hypothetical protein
MANEVQESNQRRVKKTRRNAGAMQAKIMRTANQRNPRIRFSSLFILWALFLPKNNFRILQNVF